MVRPWKWQRSRARRRGAGENQNIIQVDKAERQITKDSVHYPLKCLSSIPEAKRKAEKLEEAKGGDDGSLWDVSREHWNLEITFLKVKFRKKLQTSCGQRVSVRNGDGVEASEITTGSPGTIRFRDHAERAGPRRRRTSNNTCFLHLEKLPLGRGQLPRIQTVGFGKNWRTRDCGKVMENSMFRCRG